MDVVTPLDQASTEEGCMFPVENALYRTLPRLSLFIVILPSELT